MNINKDYEELLLFLNSVKARYLIIGAYAVIFHTEPRYTKDLDIWIQPEEKNAEKVYQALKTFGAPLEGLTLKDLVNPNMVYQVGVEPNRVDILMGIGGISFESAWKGKMKDHYGKAEVHMIGLDDLIKAKKKAGRPMDLIDVAKLQDRKKRFKRNKKA